MQCNKMENNQELTVLNQPERSKREDLHCCEMILKLKDIFQGHRLLIDIRKDFEDFMQECEMRCSEHCGNTVRDK